MSVEFVGDDGEDGGGDDDVEDDGGDDDVEDDGGKSVSLVRGADVPVQLRQGG